jgi:hypothetical protein
MRRATVFSVACLATGCAQAHATDAGLDATSVTHMDAPDGAERRVDSAPLPLEPCSTTSLDVLATEHTFVRAEFCRDPLLGSDPLPDGLPGYMIDAFVPSSVTVDGEDLLLEGLLAHRPDDAIPFACTDADCAYLLGFRVRYRVRLEGAAPFAALEEAVALDPSAVVAELHAAAAETDCGVGTRSGRLVCGTAGRWDAWSHAAAISTVSATDLVARGLPDHTEPTLVSLALVDREAHEVWWIGLQGLPDSCEHPRDLPPEEPCHPLLEPGGAYTMFAMPGTLFCSPGCSGSGPAYCPLELSCLSCCPPVPGLAYECRTRGFCQGTVDAAWLAEACAATHLDEVPPAPSAPCRGRLTTGDPCSRDVPDGPCP